MLVRDAERFSSVRSDDPCFSVSTMPEEVCLEWRMSRITTADNDDQIDHVWRPLFSKRKFNIGMLAYIVVSHLSTTSSGPLLIPRSDKIYGSCVTQVLWHCVCVELWLCVYGPPPIVTCCFKTRGARTQVSVSPIICGLDQRGKVT